MRPVRVNLARPNWRCSLLATAPLWWLVLLTGLVLTLGAGAGLRALFDERAAHAQRMRAALHTPAAPPDTRLVAPAQAQAVNAAVSQLNLPWRDLAAALDAANQADVALLALEPDARGGRLKLQVQATSSDAMLAYIEALKRQPALHSVALTHHEIKEEEARRPIHFQLELGWHTRGGQP